MMPLAAYVVAKFVTKTFKASESFKPKRFSVFHLRTAMAPFDFLVVKWKREVGAVSKDVLKAWDKDPKHQEMTDTVWKWYNVSM